MEQKEAPRYNKPWAGKIGQWVSTCLAYGWHEFNTTHG